MQVQANKSLELPSEKSFLQVQVHHKAFKKKRSKFVGKKPLLFFRLNMPTHLWIVKGVVANYQKNGSICLLFACPMAPTTTKRIPFIFTYLISQKKLRRFLASLVTGKSMRRYNLYKDKNFDLISRFIIKNIAKKRTF